MIITSDALETILKLIAIVFSAYFIVIGVWFLINVIRIVINIKRRTKR